MAGIAQSATALTAAGTNAISSAVALPAASVNAAARVTGRYQGILTFQAVELGEPTFDWAFPEKGSLVNAERGGSQIFWPNYLSNKGISIIFRARDANMNTNCFSSLFGSGPSLPESLQLPEWDRRRGRPDRDREAIMTPAEAFGVISEGAVKQYAQDVQQRRLRQALMVP
jgi:hypothetical protein